MLTPFACFFLALVGNPVLLPSDVLSFADTQDSRIYWQLRFPRTLLAIIAGGGLALSGAVFQAIFRNPLATPYTLGVASGASFGATLHITLFGYSSVFILGLNTISWAAFGGAVISMLIVYSLAQLRNAPPEQMLLAGVVANFFFSSLIVFMQYIADSSGVLRIVRWTMGGLDFPGYEELIQLTPFVLIISALTYVFARELNVLATGVERAYSIGISVERCHRFLFFATSLLVAAIVSICGPIGFVGLMVPHICRLLTGPDHSVLLIASFIVGGLFLAICDTAARTLFSVGELPVGILTGMLGAPFFLWLLFKR
jgi:iron complex transport system permease protein